MKSLCFLLLLYFLPSSSGQAIEIAVNRAQWDAVFKASICIEELAKFYKQGHISTDTMFDDVAVVGESDTERISEKDVREKQRIVELFNKIREKCGEMSTADLHHYTKAEKSVVWAGFIWFFTSGKMLQMFTIFENVQGPFKYKIKGFTLSDWTEKIVTPKRIMDRVAMHNGKRIVYYKNFTYESGLNIPAITKSMNNLFLDYYNKGKFEEMVKNHFPPNIQLSFSPYTVRTQERSTSDGSRENVTKFFNNVLYHATEAPLPASKTYFINIYNATPAVIETWWREREYRFKTRLSIFHKADNLSYPWSYDMIEIYRKYQPVPEDKKCDQFTCDD